MKSIRKKIIRDCMGACIALTSLCLLACSSEVKPDPIGDPVVEGFSPEAGRAGTELIIRGNHFGDDVERVKVSVNNISAQVLAVTATKIYALVPAAAGTGAVKVTIESKEFQPTTSFTYEFVRKVQTYSGSGAAVSVDGSLRQASFNRPYWLAYDRKDDALFVLEEGRRVRRIKDGRVETVASLSGSINNPRSISMSVSADTLFIGNDNAGNNNNVSVAILTRSTDFRVQEDYVRSTNETRHVNFAGVHPVDGTLMFYCWPRKLNTWNKTENRVELLQDLVNVAGISGDYYANFSFSPDGKEIYLVVKYPFIGVLKAGYDASSKRIVSGFQRLAGTGSWGARDGQGTEASFDQPAQSVVAADGSIFIAEKYNHMVRRVTPAGAVTRYAGDGGPGNQGFLDGDQFAAKFNEPEGIAIDKNGNIFIADLRNSRIRVIREE